MVVNAMLMKILVIALAFLCCAWGDYKIGVGISDITGPVAEITFAGYAKSTQKGCGLHLRQFARAFIIQDDSKRVLFVSADVAFVGHGLRREVLRLLTKRYGDLYTERNFILSATHTHGVPGGHMMDLLFDIPSYGFVEEVFDALSSGILKAIIRAHESRTSGKIYLNSGYLLDANVNRSPVSYLLNPKEERESYPYDVDKEMVQLKLVSTEGEPLGAIQWFAIHGTSMNSSNCLVSSDNIGYASVLFEKLMNNGASPGKGSFVAAFASSNLGDVSPNTKGPRCINTGEVCEDVSSTCKGEAKYCIAFGPGSDMFESTRIVAEKLYTKAKELWNTNSSREVTGPVKYGHQFVDMPSQIINYTLPNGTTIEAAGCLSAMGYSFAAGTTDGPGEFDFKQGTITSNVFWNAIRDFIARPTEEDIKCHHPKPILLATGRIKQPYQWQPQVVPLQVAIIGDTAIAAVPGEFTTMSGRRLRAAISDVMVESGVSSNPKVIVAGLSNIYSDYIVTYEEYQLQRYEAASTIYGPHTLAIYIHLYTKLTSAVLQDQDIEVGESPPDLSANLISLVPPVLFDLPGWKEEFGQCTQQPPTTVRIGDTVTAKFVAGHPRNNWMHNKTFLTVEKLVGNDEWIIVATDADWETKFMWKRSKQLVAESEATVEWTTDSNTEAGIYRIRHFGYYKYVLGGIFPYEGITDNFNVV